ncbi:hypothetical protein J4405_03790 [Candidatus Woesearchaeota archaeon]|nr:hypothetical protein [Candidatus Woesearchaeota archaeon]
MEKETKQILDKLEGIKTDLDYIKSHMTDVDFILTEDDFEALEEARNNLKERKTKRLN